MAHGEVPTGQKRNWKCVTTGAVLAGRGLPFCRCVVIKTCCYLGPAKS